MKDLFISFRTANQTYSVLRRSVFSLMHRAEAALFSILILCKLATNLLFVSLMQQVWSLTLRFAPMHYLSNSNASDIFTSPAIIGCIVLIAVLTPSGRCLNVPSCCMDWTLSARARASACLHCCAPPCWTPVMPFYRRTGSFWSTALR